MAKAKLHGTITGRPVGRPRRQILASFKLYYPMWKDGDITATDFAKLIGVSRPTLHKYIEEQEVGNSVARKIGYESEH